MGAQIAAHLANVNVPTLLFELPAREGDPNAIARKAIEGLQRLEPSPLALPARAAHIQPANYDQHLPLLRECDLVIEAISERIDWKAELYARVAPHLGEHAVFASNTSGLSINRLADALPAEVRARFCGLHFFNPPRYMHLVELIPAAATMPNLLDALETFLVTTLGKGVVRAKDTPNFIANRVGVFSLLATIHHAGRLSIGFDTVDALTGSLIGRPRSATFRTADVVGLDTFAHVVNTMRETLAGDPWHPYYVLPAWLDKLIETGALGQKTRRGVYQKVGADIHVLDPQSGAYRLSQGEVADEVKEILADKDVARRFERLHASEHPQARFLWSIYRDGFHYCAVHLAEIAHNARDVDLALRWGFGWDQGPFEIWQAAGWQRVAAWIAEDIAQGRAMAAVPLPPWALDVGRTGVHGPTGSFSPASGRYEPRSALPVYRRQPFPATLAGEAVRYGETIFENEGVRCWHTGDDIAIVSFKSRMHAIGGDVLDGVQRAIEEAEQNYMGLVIWQTEPPFSVGANLRKTQPGERGRKPSAFSRLVRSGTTRSGVAGAESGAADRRRGSTDGGPARGSGADARPVSGDDAGAQVFDRADGCRCRRAGARGRVRVHHALRPRGCVARKLYRAGRGRRGASTRRWRMQGIRDAGRGGSERRRPRPFHSKIFPDCRDGGSRPQCGACT